MIFGVLLAFACLVAPVFEMTPGQADGYLAGLHAAQPDFGRRLVQIAQDSLGTPYKSDPLGEGPEGKYDKDPLMDLAHVDCVTFVEQVIALAASKSYQEAFDKLQRIRYRDGKIAYENRNHFMINDWIAHNRFCHAVFGDVSGDLGVPTATVTRTVSRKAFFEKKNAPELGRDIPDETKELTYVPSAEAKNAIAKLPSPALILLVGKIDWLFVLHCGLFVRDADGKGLFYNASSTEKKVVAGDFASILESPRYLGFTAFRVEEPAY